MGKGGQGGGARISDAAARMNFLYQASAMYVSQPSTRKVSRFYAHAFKAMSQRNVQRMCVLDLPCLQVLSIQHHDCLFVVEIRAPEVKRTICKQCSTLLVPGVSATQSFESVGQPRTVLKCNTCGLTRVFLMQKYRTIPAVPVENPINTDQAVEIENQPPQSAALSVSEPESPCVVISEVPSSESIE
jgi:ribonuclease P protein subunit RPR2